MASSRLPPPQPIDPGVAGLSAVVGDDRRAPPRGRSTGDLVRAAVARGVRRERRLGRLLDRELGPVAVVLHDRRVADVNPTIDHLVVAASGVWVIEARHERGRIVRDRRTPGGGAWLRRPSAERTEVVARNSHVDVVRCHLDPMGFDWLDVRRVVCLTNAGWGTFGRPFEVGEVLVTWGRALVPTIAVPGALGPVDMKAVAVELSAKLPATI